MTTLNASDLRFDEVDQSTINRFNPISKVKKDSKLSIQIPNNLAKMTNSHLIVDNESLRFDSIDPSKIQRFNPICQQSNRKNEEIEQLHFENVDYKTLDMFNPIFQPSIMQPKKKGEKAKSKSLIEEPNPKIIEDKTHSQFMPGPETQRPKFATKNSSRKKELTAKEIADYFKRYEQKFEIGSLLYYLSRQSCSIFKKTEHRQKIIFEYILKLKALLLVFKQESDRIDQGVENHQKHALIQDCKGLINQLYNELKILRKSINASYTNLYQFENYKKFVNKLILNKNKIYTIFRLDQIRSCFKFILEEAYSKVFSTFQQRRTQIHIRLALLTLISANAYTIFEQGCLEQNFKQFIEYKNIKNIEQFDIGQIYGYILEADAKLILKHHKSLRKMYILSHIDN